ncbi:MAG: TetR family transcriptional regulator [Oscillospiraceae bacterium]|nr:TetR family transcriptional regulator [Oscillospiraceae bacterium]
MYQGNNKTALASQRQIALAMLRLMETHPYQDISVRLICDTANVSRQTFYSLFRSKENVIFYALESGYNYTPEVVNRSYCLDDLCTGFCGYIVENVSFIRLLSENEITQFLSQTFYDSLFSCPCFLPDLNPQTRQYAADFVASGFASLAKTYILLGESTDRKQLERIAYALLNGSLFR